MNDGDLFEMTHRAGDLFIKAVEAYAALSRDHESANEMLSTFNDRISRASEFLAGISTPSAVDFVPLDEHDLAMREWPSSRIADVLNDEIRGEAVPHGVPVVEGALAALNRVLSVLELFARTAALRGHPLFVNYENRALAVAGLYRPRQECLSYADQVRLTYQEIDYPGSGNPPGEMIQMTIQPGGGVDIDRLRIAAEGWMDSTTHIADLHYKHHSWGADAAVLAFLLQAGASGVVGGAAWDALKALGRRVTASRSDAPCPRPLSEAEVVDHARFFASSRFGGAQFDDESVQSVALDAAWGRVVLKANDGSLFAVEVELDHGMVVLGGPITREYPPS